MEEIISINKGYMKKDKKDIYIQEFTNNEDVISKYSAPPNAVENAEVLLAWYGYGDYCGSSFVLFKKEGKLYEVNGSHCSCYGLEGQWQPEETNKESLYLRATEGYTFYECESSEVAKERLLEVVNTL